MDGTQEVVAPGIVSYIYQPVLVAVAPARGQIILRTVTESFPAVNLVCFSACWHQPSHPSVKQVTVI